MMYLVIKGDPVDGFQYIGPFMNAEVAERYMDHNDSDAMWVVKLITPYGDDDA